MGDLRAQEFWDRMWLREKYEAFPSESVDDLHLVVQHCSVMLPPSKTRRTAVPNRMASFIPK